MVIKTRAAETRTNKETMALLLSVTAMKHPSPSPEPFPSPAMALRHLSDVNATASRVIVTIDVKRVNFIPRQIRRTHTFL
jgi:hypothetical protein